MGRRSAGGGDVRAEKARAGGISQGPPARRHHGTGHPPSGGLPTGEDGWRRGVSRYGREICEPGKEGAPAALPARHPEHKTYPTGNQALPPTASQYGYFAGAYLAKTGTRRGCRKGSRGASRYPRRDASRDSEGHEAVALWRLAARARTRAETSRAHLYICRIRRRDMAAKGRRVSVAKAARRPRGTADGRRAPRFARRPGGPCVARQGGRRSGATPPPRVTSRCAGSYQ